MRRTLTTLALISALLHLYLGWRLLPALPFGTTGIVLGVLWLSLSALLTPAPLLARGFRDPRHGDLLGWVGYLMMGLFSSLLVLTLLRELLLLAAWLLPAGALGADPAPWSALAVLAGTALVSLLGFANARRTARVVTVDVPVAGLPAALQGFRIAQVSDIHVGHTIKRDYLQAVVERVNALQPDLIALTGDLVDGSVATLREHTAPFAALRARHGAYAVTGNHEYYSGAASWVAEWRRLGLVPLLNEHRVIEHDGARLLVAGVTDYSAHIFDPAQRSDPAAALAGAPAGIALKLLLAHQPRSAPVAADAGFDLQLSGHTHGGQFLPWTWFVPLQQPFTAGLHRLRELWVYTSRGTGYWGPPLRFGAPSEITLIRLVAA